MRLSRRASLGLSAAALALLSSGAAMAADYTLRVHTLVKSPHPYNDMAAAFKEQVEAESGGAIEVEIFDSGQLGQDPAVIGEIGFGTIDMMISTTSNAAQQIPEYSIFTMPYLFQDMDQALEKVGPGSAVEAHFQQVYEERSVGMKLLALGASGTRNMSTVSVPVEGPGDIDGLKMRTPPSPMDSKTWAAFGMLPVTVAWGELYAAMQTGVADAMESSLPGYTGSKLYEVAPNLALTAHTIQVNHTSISQRTWDKLPEDMQAVVLAAAQAANSFGVEKAKGYDDALVETLKTEHGVSVTIPDKAPFIEVVSPMQVQLAEELDLVEEYELLTE
ncbi:TRAP transporter substrate-binding protein [Tropicimonas sediminicola]|uniref:Tripartite ATP-independent transporter solute receptor, DctP family n=1 Tax=Tropicimonas sediminicola TaxID=1031541 RepID=A0A239CZ41_9RHOB|nr:TRAP transporter substrate-binding protein [Tropicimonas sediminicola]SNS25317.1 tripartite ATP-independent transporter solute receptor, DctP family [Tropicimonas sediminicola]